MLTLGLNDFFKNIITDITGKILLLDRNVILNAENVYFAMQKVEEVMTESIYALKWNQKSMNLIPKDGKHGYIVAGVLRMYKLLQLLLLR